MSGTLPMADAVERVVAQAPAITPAQRQRLAAILATGGAR